MSKDVDTHDVFKDNTFRTASLSEVVDFICKKKPHNLIIRNLEYAKIVRCKDCRYMTEHYDTDGNVPYWTCSEWDGGTDYDGYCHFGEKKEDAR